MIVKTHAPRTSVGTKTVLPKKGIFILDHPISLFSISLPTISHLHPWKLLSRQMSSRGAGGRHPPHTSLYMFRWHGLQSHKRLPHVALHQPSRPELEPRMNG